MQDKLLFKLGQSIRYIRLQKNMSQEELGFKSELSTNSISSIERGAYNFKIKTLNTYYMIAQKEHKKELFLDDNFSEVIIKIQVHKRELICMHNNHNRLLNLLI